MATAVPRYQGRMNVQQDRAPLTFRLPFFQMKRTTLISFVFGMLTFAAALYYVEQHVQLRSLNYDIIALKEQRKALLEEQKTLQLRLDQFQRLDLIEAEMLDRGFVPVAEGQIRIVTPEPEPAP